MPLADLTIAAAGVTIAIALYLGALSAVRNGALSTIRAWILPLYATLLIACALGSGTFPAAATGFTIASVALGASFSVVLVAERKVSKFAQVIDMQMGRLDALVAEPAAEEPHQPTSDATHFRVAVLSDHQDHTHFLGYVRNLSDGGPNFTTLDAAAAATREFAATRIVRNCRFDYLPPATTSWSRRRAHPLL